MVSKVRVAVIVAVVLTGSYAVLSPRRAPGLGVFETDLPSDSRVNDRYQPPNTHGSFYSELALDGLASWEAATQLMPFCTAASHIYDGYFYKTHSGEILYEPALCKLRRITGPEARTCLANKTILFVGDSVSRYQYVSFAHFLANGVYPGRYGDDPGRPNICMERQFNGGWTGYFANSSAALSASATDFVANETCTCSREDGERVTSDAYEHRRLLVHLLAPEPATITVVYNQTLKWPSIFQATYNALHRGLMTRTIDVAVVNAGAWLSHVPTMKAATIAKAFEQLFALPARVGLVPKLIWRSMSESSMPPKVNRAGHMLTGLARFYSWDVLDAWYVTQQAREQGVALRWDHVHFLPVMYDQWNDLLLHHLCAT